MASVIAVDPLEPWGAASAAYRLEMLARTLPFPVSGARLVPSNNNDVWRLEAGYLRVAWRGDRSRLAREAELLGRLRGFLPVPDVLNRGGDDRLSWSLTAAMPGIAYERLCVRPAPGGLRSLAREVAALLRALHSWPVPAELAGLLRRPERDSDPLRRAGSELVLLPSSAVLGLIPLAGQLPFVDHGVLDAAAQRGLIAAVARLAVRPLSSSVPKAQGPCVSPCAPTSPRNPPAARPNGTLGRLQPALRDIGVVFWSDLPVSGGGFRCARLTRRRWR